MIGKSDIKRLLGVEVDISSAMMTALAEWAKMYENRAEWLSKTVRSLNLPAAVAGAFATSVTLEMEVEVTGASGGSGARAEFLHEQLQRILPSLREQVEYGVAKGGLIMKPWVDGDQLAVDFSQADQFIPVAFDSRKRPSKCIFVYKLRQGDYYYTRLEFHEFLGYVQDGARAEGSYRIRNKVLRSTSDADLGSVVPLSSVPEWADLSEEESYLGVRQPLFGYFRFPQANNIEPGSPLGVSAYARAVDLIKQADIQWSQLLWEFKSGSRRLTVDEQALPKDPKTGKFVVEDVELYRVLRSTNNVGAAGKLFEDWSPTFREQAIINGLEAILKRIEFNCGMARGMLSDPQQVDKTATEVLSSKQQYAATVVDIQKALETAIRDLLYAMDAWTSIFKLAPKGGYEATFTFDDSLVTDRQQQFAQDTQMVNMRAMGPVELRMRTYGESEAVAKQKVAEAQASQTTELFPEEE
ncbi:MAG: phage portal protein [Anaerolineales bacterium]|nr:phage portal protein [Anaerolineales bacterium]